MNSPHWSQTDRHRAQEYIAEAPSTLWLDCQNGLVAVRPHGWSALGMRFHGGFMLAPLPILTALILMMFIVVSSRYGLGSGITLGVGVFFLALLWGLGRVFQMLTRNRDLFPIKYFSTLGAQGVAMHFSRFHFPLRDPQARLDWDEVTSVQKITGIFIPAWFHGRFHIPLLEIRSLKGKTVVIPIVQLSHQEQDLRNIEKLIQEKTHRQ